MKSMTTKDVYLHRSIGIKLACIPRVSHVRSGSKDRYATPISILSAVLASLERTFKPYFLNSTAI